MNLKVNTFDLRELSGAITVTALAAGFGVIVVSAAEALGSGMSASSIGQSETVRGVLLTISWIFLGLAFFVGGIVTANTFATIIVGRAQRLALFRLLGASKAALRSACLREGIIAGIVGAVSGGLVGILATQGAIALGKRFWGFPAETSAPWVSVSIIAPVIAAVLMTALSSWIGSRGVLGITPVEAFGNAQAGFELREDIEGKVKIGSKWTMGMLGILLLVGGIAIGFGSPLGVLIAFPGGVLTFIAFMMNGQKIIPPILQWGSQRSRKAPQVLAARNTSRNPKRSTRTAMGIIIGVGLITMFTVVAATYARVAEEGFGEELFTQEMMLPALIVLMLVGFSTLLAVVGLLNNARLNAIQRQHEISLLRALGLTEQQTRTMVMLEALRMAGISALIGLGLGIFYGWAGAASSIGSLMKVTGAFAPAIPWQLVVAVVIGAGGVTIVATLAAMRKVVEAKPTLALAEA